MDRPIILSEIIKKLSKSTTVSMSNFWKKKVLIISERDTAAAGGNTKIL
jgi:hypothetical protein